MLIPVLLLFAPLSLPEAGGVMVLIPWISLQARAAELDYGSLDLFYLTTAAGSLLMVQPWALPT